MQIEFVEAPLLNKYNRTIDSIDPGNFFETPDGRIYLRVNDGYVDLVGTCGWSCIVAWENTFRQVQDRPCDLPCRLVGGTITIIR